MRRAFLWVACGAIAGGTSCALAKRLGTPCLLSITSGSQEVYSPVARAFAGYPPEVVLVDQLVGSLRRELSSSPQLRELSAEALSAAALTGSAGSANRVAPCDSRALAYMGASLGDRAPGGMPRGRPADEVRSRCLPLSAIAVMPSPGITPVEQTCAHPAELTAGGQVMGLERGSLDLFRKARILKMPDARVEEKDGFLMKREGKQLAGISSGGAAANCCCTRVSHIPSGVMFS